MFGSESEKECDHRDSGKSRMRQDEEDVLRLVSQFKKYDVFRHTTDLVAVTTGDVASAEIKEDLREAEETGKAAIIEFVNDRLVKKGVKFHDRIKLQKLKTFKMLYSVPVIIDNSKTISMKADRDLLRRVVVALESGREIDVDTLLQREFSPIPLSLATPEGNIRSAPSKADLSNVLQENVAQTHTPSNQD